MEKTVSRGILCWMILITGLFIGLLQENNEKDPIFQFGPNSQLFILSICINTSNKYLIVVLFCVINSGIRVLNHSILSVYIMNIIQDKMCPTAHHSYEISLINSVYTWFDFFMFINIIFSQIDMFLIEVLSDIIVTTIVTRYYLKCKPNEIKNDKIVLIIE